MEGRASAFLNRYGLGIALLVLFVRSDIGDPRFRDNFGGRALDRTRLGHVAAVFTASELPLRCSPLTVLGVIIVVRDTRRRSWSFTASSSPVCCCSLCRHSPFRQDCYHRWQWMILSGAGLYMAYVPSRPCWFDR